jgi:signal transduction histidine kinase/ligand-binding sensor domain-containing protein
MCSLQDKQGFVWLGTKDGLNRFDGNSFKVYRNDAEDPATIGNGYIRCLYQDRLGRMFIGTQQGLYRYHPRTESFSHIAPSGTKSIKEVITDAKGNLWFIAEGLLNRYREKDKQVRSYDISRYSWATSMCLLDDGSFWVATADGLLKKYIASTDSFITHDVFQTIEAPTSRWIEKLYSPGKGSILIGTSAAGLLSFDITTSAVKSIVSHNKDKTGIYVRDILKFKQDQYWLATESGIFIYYSGNDSVVNLKKNYLDPYSLSDNAVYTLCKDREGGLWAGTYFGGVNYYAQQNAQFQKHYPDYGKNSISGNAVREITKDRYGNLWIGTEDAGLNKLSPNGSIQHFMPTGSKTSISYYNIHGLLAVNDVLWISTHEHGVDVLDIRSGKVRRHYEAGNKAGDLKSNFVLSFYRTRAGDVLLSTTAGVFAYQPATDDFRTIPALTGYTYNILEDRKGVLWSATISDGVKFYDPKTGVSGSFQHNPKDRNSLGSNMVNALFEDNRGNLWIATEGGGACRLGADRKTFKRYSTKNGFPSNFVFKILEDDQSNLWISTSKGLIQLNAVTEVLTIYNRANGLLNEQFNYNSGYKDATGQLYFGSVKGMISFNPNNFARNNFVPPVYITGFQVQNKELLIRKGSPLSQSIVTTDAITLPYDQSSFSIDFAALSYIAPRMNAYAYKMEGLDRGWTHLASNRKVYFTNLSPGRYTFKVKAANNSGAWNAEEAKLTITILPPWWSSTSAYVFYCLCSIGFGLYLVRNYHRQMEKKNRQKMDQLGFEKEKEVYEAKMKFFTNIAHEIRTPLSLIKAPLERVINKAGHLPEIKNSLAIMEQSTNQLIDLTNQLLDYRQTEAGGFRLHFQKEHISELLEDTYASFKPLAEQRNLDYRLILPTATLVAYADKEALIKILNNLLSNAVKYANNEVVVHLSTNEADSTFTIEIKNDGYLIPRDMKERIFEPFVRLKKTEKQKGTGIGLALARSLTELHQGKLYVKEGTEKLNVFVLTLPVYQQRPTRKERADLSKTQLRIQ